MQYYSVGPFRFEYYKKRLQCDVIIERTIAKDILPKTLYCNSCAV